jgi:hypothetical protein
MSTEHRPEDEFIPVNQILNAKPQLGPIPAEQVIPWIVIAIVSYLICQGLLQLDWWATLLVTVWGAASWWVLTGNESWRFLNKFHRVPNWRRGHLPHTSLLMPSPNDELGRCRNRSTKSLRHRTRK